MPAYYNENDPFAAAWLRELINRDLIALGVVDERSITDVQPSDLTGFTQHHFFAGIGGWSYALRLARWPDDRPAWTGSCPCQPFSAAGKGLGFSDPRHLWPVWFRLLREHKPVIVFGEQVDKATAWLDLVSGDLESEGYAIGAAVLGAHSVGAPHRRQRIYWVADSPIPRRPGAGQHDGGSSPFPARPAEYGGMEQPAQQQMGISGLTRKSGSADVIMGHSDPARPQGRSLGRYGSSELAAGTGGVAGWADLEWLPCRDSKSRPTQPGLFPLAHGIPGRVGRLRGYGNAIVPQVAAAFVEAYLEL